MSQQPNYNQPEDIESTINFQELFFEVLSKKWWVVTAVVIGMVVGYLMTMGRMPVYQVNATLQLTANQQQNSNALSVLLGDQQNQASQKASEQQVITSRRVLGAIVEQLGLNVRVTPTYFPYIGHLLAHYYYKRHGDAGIAKPLFGLSQYDWGNSYAKVTSFKVPHSLEGHKFTLKYNGDANYQLLDNNKNIVLNGKIGDQTKTTLNGEEVSINVSQIHANPGTQFEVEALSIFPAVNSLAQKISFEQSTKSGQSDIMHVYFNSGDPSTGARNLNAIIDKAIEVNTNLNAQQAKKTLEFLQQQLPIVSSSLQKSQNALTNYQTKTGLVSISDQGKEVIGRLSDLSTTISQLELQKSQLLQQYTANSFQVQKINDEISALKAQKDGFNQQLKGVPDADQKLVNLTRDVNIQQDIYTNLLNQIQTYELMQAGTLSQLTVLDKATPYPVIISKPNSTFVKGGGVAGLLIGIILVLILHLIRNEIKDPQVIEEMISTPLLTSLYESDKSIEINKQFKENQIPHLKMLDEIDHYDITLESFRSLMTSLKFNLVNDKKIITISGPSPDVGKSFVSANLAQVFASHGKRVLLIDGDLRRGHIRDYFKINYIPGWIEFLEGKAQRDEVLHKTRLENLWFIPTGNHNRKHYLNIMGSENTRNILKGFKQEFDVIIIDTAPVLAASDAVVMYEMSDVNLMVYAHKRHSPKEITQSMQQIRNNKINLDGFIFNRVQDQVSGYYGYGYKYSYKNRYRYKYQYRYRYDTRKQDEKVE